MLAQDLAYDLSYSLQSLKDKKERGCQVPFRLEGGEIGVEVMVVVWCSFQRSWMNRGGFGDV
jgi:hypothetical protein